MRQSDWIVRAQRNVAARPLAPEPLTEHGRNALRRYVPLWAVYLAVGIVAVLLYGGLRYALDGQVGQTVAALQRIDPQP